MVGTERYGVYTQDTDIIPIDILEDQIDSEQNNPQKIFIKPDEITNTYENLDVEIESETENTMNDMYGMEISEDEQTPEYITEALVNNQKLEDLGEEYSKIRKEVNTINISSKNIDISKKIMSEGERYGRKQRNSNSQKPYKEKLWEKRAERKEVG